VSAPVPWSPTGKSSARSPQMFCAVRALAVQTDTCATHQGHIGDSCSCAAPGPKASRLHQLAFGEPCPQVAVILLARSCSTVADLVCQSLLQPFRNVSLGGGQRLLRCEVRVLQRGRGLHPLRGVVPAHSGAPGQQARSRSTHATMRAEHTLPRGARQPNSLEEERCEVEGGLARAREEAAERHRLCRRERNFAPVGQRAHARPHWLHGAEGGDDATQLVDVVVARNKRSQACAGTEQLLKQGPHATGAAHAQALGAAWR
jgi:hypothetical protein